MEKKSWFSRSNGNKSEADDSNEREYEYEVVNKSREELPVSEIFNQTSILKRSISTPNFNTSNTDKDTETVAEVIEQLLLTKIELKQKIEECKFLRSQNSQLSNLLQNNTNGKSVFRKVFFLNRKERQIDATNTPEEIQPPFQRIPKLEVELKVYKKLKAKLDEVVREKSQLKLHLTRRIEINNEMLENLEEKIINRDEELKMERKLREEREIEIMHIQSYSGKKELYYENQLQQKKEKIKEMEIRHLKEIDVLKMLSKQKDEEILELSINNNNSTKNENESLVNLLQLKTKQLDESNKKLKQIQEQLNDKCKELENVALKLENCKIKHETIEKLEKAKQQISEVLSDIDKREQSVSERSSTQEMSEDLWKKMGDKEEAI